MDEREKFVLASQADSFERHKKKTAELIIVQWELWGIEKKRKKKTNRRRWRLGDKCDREEEKKKKK